MLQVTAEHQWSRGCWQEVLWQSFWRALEEGDGELCKVGRRCSGSAGGGAQGTAE